MRLVLIFLLFFSVSCERFPSKTQDVEWKDIRGRVEKKLYRAKVPKSWKEETVSEGLLADTTKPLLKWTINSHSTPIQVTVHNFPRNIGAPPIPPNAQIERWKRQFDLLDPTTVSVEPESHGGFVGLIFQGEGEIENKKCMIIGSSMILGKELEDELTFFIKKNLIQKEMLADYTIKATGEREMLPSKKEEIMGFITSFELIEDLPIRY